MKIFYLFILLSLPSWAQGTFKLFHASMTYPGSSYHRQVWVYLPAGYEKSNRRYPVIYMQDGQNLFDPARAYLGQTWRAKSTLDRLIQSKVITPIILVAIDNTPDRMEEYVPGQRGNDYLNFLVHQLKPLIDRNFRTQLAASSTAIMGSSLGGLISLHAGITHSTTFGLIGALSPSIWWKERAILAAYVSSPYLPVKVYLDSGTQGGERPQDVWDLTQLLLERQFQWGQTLSVFIQEGAEHSEYYWAMRFPEALKFFFS